MSELELSIIIPTYNEEQRLARSLMAIDDYLKRQDYAGEVLVVDDGSRDRTVEVAEGFLDRMSLRIIAQEVNRGKGRSVRAGMLAARGKWRLFTDADLSTPIEELDKFWPRTKEGCEVLIGSRALAGSQVDVHQNPLREAMGRVFNLLLRMSGLSGIRDTQCGFKMFSARAAGLIFEELELAGFAFDVEALLRARRHDLRIAEIPVRWINSPDSKVRVVRDSLRMLFDIMRLKIKGL